MFALAIPRFAGNNDTADAQGTETESVSTSKKSLPPRPPPILKKTKPTSPSRSSESIAATLQPSQHLAATNVREGSSAGGSSLNVDPSPHTSIGKSSERSSKTTRFQTDERRLERLPQTMREGNVGDEYDDSHGKGKQKAGRRKVTVVANTGAGRKRPVVRQRSSQSSSSSVSVTSSSQSEIEPAGGGVREQSAAVAARTRVESSLSSMLKQQKSHQDKTALEQEDRAPQQPADPSRSANADMTKISGSRAIPSHPSFTSLPSILKKSSAAAATPASYQASGTIDFGQQSRHGNHRMSDVGSADNSSRPVLQDHPRLEQERGSSTQPLPRSKSQLAILLQKGHKPSGDR